MALADASLVAERYLVPLRKMTHAVVWVASSVFTRYRGLRISMSRGKAFPFESAAISLWPCKCHMHMFVHMI